MKHFTICLIFIFSSIANFCSGQVPNEEKIAATAIQIGRTNSTDFSFLKKKLENKRILILGEATHQDGSTFHMKVQLIKYLMNNMGFKTVMLEGSGLFDSYLVNGGLKGTPETDYMIKKYGMLAIYYPMWSNTREVRPLDSLFLEQKLKCVGMDCQPNYTSIYFIKSLKTYTDSIDTTILNDHNWKYLDSVSRCADMGKLDTSVCLYAIKILLKIAAYIKSQKPELNSEGDTYIQCIKNEIAFLNELNAPSLYDSKPVTESEKRTVNIIRDGQMADNVQWYLTRHPNDKIIIWTANFHGCKNLKNIRYKSNDSLTYKKDTVLGELLNGLYGSTLYSLAFTSYEYADTNKIVALDTTHTSLEYYLYKTGYAYGFVGNDALRVQYNKVAFKSLILGDDLKEGDWINDFDGIFYIRQQDPPHQEPFH